MREELNPSRFTRTDTSWIQCQLCHKFFYGGEEGGTIPLNNKFLSHAKEYHNTPAVECRFCGLVIEDSPDATALQYMTDHMEKHRQGMLPITSQEGEQEPQETA